jgi:SAM-dependent methyltransferase
MTTTPHALPLMVCPGCRSEASAPAHIGAHPLKRCRECGLVYAATYVPPDELYVEGYFAGGAGVDTRHPEFDAYLNFVAACRVDLIEKVAQPPARLLDVGCGTGQTLAEAARRGWETVGVDLVPDAVQQAVERFGLDARNVALEESGLPERSFDVVATTQVLEHQLDGPGFLASIARWARPGGYLFIEVPNWNGAVRRADREGWVLLRPHEHVAHYTTKTLSRTVRRAGLEPVAVSTPCFQFSERQTLNQALRDLGLARVAPHLQRDLFTVPGTQRDEAVRLPRPSIRRVLHGAERVLNVANAGVMIAMMAKVP